MTRLRCCYCQKPYDALQGHSCVYKSGVQRRMNRNNTSFKMIEEKQDDISQFTSPATEEQIYHPTLATLELEYANPDSSNPTNITQTATISNEESTEFFQNYASERIGGQSMVGNSEQPHRSDLNVRNYPELPLNNELGRIDNNLPSTSRVLNSEMVKLQRHRTSLHFGGNEGHPVSNTRNLEVQKAIADIIIDSYVENKLRSDTVSKGHQQLHNAIKSTSLLKTNLAHEYEIGGGSNKIPAMNRRVLKYRQTALGMVRGETLGNATHDLKFKETERNQRLMATNINAINITNDTVTDTRTLDTQVRWRENVAGKIPRGCPSETSENKLTFNDETYKSSQNETSAKKISAPRISESSQSFSTDDASAVAGPSCSQDMKITCPVCHKEFSNKSNMKMHYKIHSGEKPFTCEICEKGFKQKGNLIRHMFGHTGAKPHKCNICGGCFATKGNLKSHLVIHVDVKPYKCKICCKTFKRRNDVKKHISIHRKVTF